MEKWISIPLTVEKNYSFQGLLLESRKLKGQIE